MTITQDRLKELSTYNPDTGVFIGTVSRGKGNRFVAGGRMGTPDKKGYIHMTIDGKTYGAHRLAWLYCFGEWPKCHIDHINRDPSDNRIKNLRKATHSENTCNTPGKKGKNLPKGISACSGKFVAKVVKNGVLVLNCRVGTLEEAKKAVEEAREKYHGEFHHHG